MEWEEEFRGFPFSYKKQENRRAFQTEQAFGPLGLAEKARKELEDKWYSQLIDLMSRYKPPGFYLEYDPAKRLLTEFRLPEGYQGEIGLSATI